MKVLICKKDRIIREVVYTCPQCNEAVIREFDNFCSCCGTAIEWEDNSTPSTGTHAVDVEILDEFAGSAEPDAQRNLV